MKNALITFSTGLIVFIFSFNVSAAGAYQASAMPPLSFEVTPAHLWSYVGNGTVKEVLAEQALIIIHTNMGSAESPLLRDVAYAVRDLELLDNTVVNSTIKYSYYHQPQYDVILKIEHDN